MSAWDEDFRAIAVALASGGIRQGTDAIRRIVDVAADIADSMAQIRAGRIEQKEALLFDEMRVTYTYEDGQWVAEIATVPGARACGQNRKEACAKVLAMASEQMWGLCRPTSERGTP